LLEVTDLADVFALCNLPALTNQPDSSNLLLLSQENARILEVNRSGNILSSLQIVADVGSSISVAAQQHEGLTMDGDGFIYVVNENGGGDINHPELWVYAPADFTNQPPVALLVTNQLGAISESASTTFSIKVADLFVVDDGIGTNVLSVSGVDAVNFEIIGTALHLKAGTALDFETKTNYSVVVVVDDFSAGGTPDATNTYSLAVTDVVNENSAPQSLIISEVAPWSSGNSPVAADWFEIINTSSLPINIAGWKMDDNSKSFAAAGLLGGVTNIAPGEAVVFIDTASLAAKAALFRTNWFGANPPASLQIGHYTGVGGLSTAGDQVNLYDSLGNLRASVAFAASPGTAPRGTFDNAFGLNHTTVSQLSSVGVHGAFVAANSPNEIGSPGTGGKVIITEVAPWADDISPVAADWFELSNTGATPVDVSGWRMDDSSQNFAGSMPLIGITNIAPGESVIFIETEDLVSKRADFQINWFGTNPPVGLRIGSYTGSGVDLSADGDGVSLYNSNGVLVALVTFGASPAGPYPTFDNAAGLDGLLSSPLTQMSEIGTNGAYAALNSAQEIGSPGIMRVPLLSLTVSETDATLRWPVDAVGYRLEDTLTLEHQSGWTHSIDGALTNGQLGATVPLTNDMRFFRLRKH
jgi:hypothetical protein